jgi:pilus assembly protein CpaE
LITDGAAFYQLQEEMRAAFECTVVDLPRGMLVQHAHLITDIQIAVIVTELTLAAARDTIRLLSWLKTNAPQTTVMVVANRLHAGGQLEINRKDFEGSIERKLDYVVTFDQKLAAQAAKLGKPLVEAGKNSKTVAPIVALASEIASSVEEGVATDAPKARKGISLIGKFGELKGLMPKRAVKTK